MGTEYILELKHISKSFPGVKALDDVTLCVRPGTVHSLIRAVADQREQPVHAQWTLADLGQPDARRHAKNLSSVECDATAPRGFSGPRRRSLTAAREGAPRVAPVPDSPLRTICCDSAPGPPGAQST